MLHKYSDRVYYTDYDEVSDRPVLGYVTGERHSALIDAGSSPKHINEVLGEIRELGLREPDFVIITHSHWDHTYGLRALNIPAICNRLTYDLLKQDSKKIWDKEHFEEYKKSGLIEPFIFEHMEIEYSDISEVRIRLPEIVYDRHLSIDLGGLTIETFLVTNAHSKDGSVVLVKEEKVLFLGDSFYTELVGPDWVDHPDLVGEYHRELTPVDFEVAFPAHTDKITRAEMFAELTERESA
ncbi:MAG: MBL fold metallo-hydrolase [Erysipelotrichaceae bacterium]|nr:MBL fold metallo-hydrolase [Erysipelotrichaceae bacterium]